MLAIKPWKAALLAVMAACAQPAYSQTLLRVDARATSTPHDGSDWDHAYRTIQEALAAASNPATTYHILIASGTFLPDESSYGSHSGLRTDSFVLHDKISLKGGYEGLDGNPLSDARSITDYPTILSGNIGDPGDPNDNSYHVITVDDSVTNLSVIDGIDVLYGLAQGATDPVGSCIYIPNGGNPQIIDIDAEPATVSGDVAASGGAIYINSPGEPISIIGRRNSTIPGPPPVLTGRSGRIVGRSSGDGGTIYVVSSTLLLKGCDIAGFAGSDGGCVYAECSTSVTIREVEAIEGASAGVGEGQWGNGGAFHLTAPTVSLRDTRVLKGNALDSRSCKGGLDYATYGGAAYIDADTTKIRDCFFQSGIAGYGGGIAVFGTSLICMNTRFEYDQAAWRGGSIYADGLDSVILANCVVNGATASQVFALAPNPPCTSADCYPLGSGEGGAVALVDCESASVVNCTIVNCRAGLRGAGILADDGTTLAVANTIAWDQGWADCATPGDPDDLDLVATGGASISVTYSNIQYDSNWSGTGVISSDPKFTSLSPTLFTLCRNSVAPCSSASPCVDAGNNSALPTDSLDLDGDMNTGEAIPVDAANQLRRVDIASITDTGNGTPPIVDMGAYEAQILPCIADWDGDGAFTPSDIAYFVNQWLLDLTNSTLYTDIDNNNAVEPADIAAFVTAWLNALASGGCP